MRKLRPLRRLLQAIALTSLLAVFVACICAGSALAAGGALINVGTELGGRTEQPAIAVDSSGTAYIAWPQATSKGAIAKTIAYCTVPAGNSSCSQQGTLTPAGSPAKVESVSLAVDGDTVVLVASFYDVNPENGRDQEWLAADGSANFTAVNSGKGVAKQVSEPIFDLVVLPGTNSLGVGSGELGDGSAQFSAWTGTSSLSDPPVCSIASCSQANTADLNVANSAFGSQAHQDYASQTGAEPGVLGVFDTPYNACSSGEQGTSFIYGSGLQSSTNSYAYTYFENLDSAWKPIANIDCTGYHPAVAGGPSGLGELEWDGESRALVYRPFDQAAVSFGSPVTVSKGQEFGEDTSLSQDGSGGIYASWFEGETAIRFAYSPNGGAGWEGPVSLTTGSGAPAEVTSAVGSDGQGWAASTEQVGESVQVYVQPFVKGDAYVAPAGGGNTPPSLSLAPAGITTSQSGGGQSGASISITAGTTGETDQAKITGANAAVAGGIVHYYLYADSTCDPGTGIVFDGGSRAVTGGVAGPSQPVTEALGPGRYYWQAEYSGDTLNSPVTSACGAEVLNVLPAASAGSSGSTNGSTVTVTVTCESSEPCTVAVTITATEVTVAVKASAAGRKKVKHTKMITLAGGTFKVGAHSSKKLTVHLTKAGKALLRKEHGHLKGTILVADKTAHGIEQSKHDISITTKRK